MISLPAEDTLTPQNYYIKLKEPLYGLKQIPRHWYNMLTKTLKAMGLQQSSNSPCIFHGSLLPNEPPIHLGIYVDDIIYFLNSNTFEQKFESMFQTHHPTKFSGPVIHFVGLKLTHVRHPEGYVLLYLTQSVFIDHLLKKL